VGVGGDLGPSMSSSLPLPESTSVSRPPLFIAMHLRDRVFSDVELSQSYLRFRLSLASAVAISLWYGWERGQCSLAGINKAGECDMREVGGCAGPKRRIGGHVPTVRSATPLRTALRLKGTGGRGSVICFKCNSNCTIASPNFGQKGAPHASNLTSSYSRETMTVVGHDAAAVELGLKGCGSTMCASWLVGWGAESYGCCFFSSRSESDRQKQFRGSLFTGT